MKNNYYSVSKVKVVIPQSTMFFYKRIFVIVRPSYKHILEIQIIVNIYLFSHTHKDDGFETFLPIKYTCVATTSLDMTNEENIEDALPME